MKNRLVLMQVIFLAALAPCDQAEAQAQPLSANLPRTYAPTLPRTVAPIYPWHRNITATIFWIGEKSSAANPRHNEASSWDTKWMQNYGGYDDPNPANRSADFRPKRFIPGLNPFYIALPYNDRINWAKTKASAKRVIPWFSRTFKGEGKTVCNMRWVAIHCRGRICYAQWSDVGPFGTDDWAYVFGGARPKNSKNNSAGIDISPAVRDYLEIRGGNSKCDWRFVELHEIPYGPWRKFGRNNHFIRMAPLLDRTKREEIERLKRARDEWLKRRSL